MPTVLFTVFSLPVTAFAVWTAAGALLCCAVTLLRARAKGIGRDRTERFLLLSLILGVFCGHLAYTLARILYVYYDYGMEAVLNPLSGGFLFFGALAGVALAAKLAGLKENRGFSRLLDAAAPGLMILIALCRLGEPSLSQGYGPQIENERLFFFPLAFRPFEWDEWYFALYLAEALWALGCACFLLLNKKKRAAGQETLMALILYCAAQIVFESLRRDITAKWLFVRVSQLLSVVALGLTLLVCMLLRRRFRVGRFLLFLVFTGGCVALEFALDKPLMLGDRAIYFANWLVYVLEILCAAAMGILTWRTVIGERFRSGNSPFPAGATSRAK